MIKTVNLDTGDEMLWSECLPAEAVIKAHLYSAGKHNTWEWPQRIKDMMVNVSYGKYCVRYGAWCALWRNPE